MTQNNKEIIESLSPIERKIMPYLKEQNFDLVIKHSGEDRVTALRALEFLNSKGIINLHISKKKIVDLGTNGIFYKKKGLPERQLLHLIEKKSCSLEEAQKESKLSQNEFRAALGALKKKAMIELKNGKIMLNSPKNEIAKKTLEETFIDELPLDYNQLKPEQLFALNNLRERKEIIEIREEQIIKYEVTELGKQIIKEDLSSAESLIEELTPEMIKIGSWKGKKFRRYDVISQVPRIYGGKRHFVSQATDYARKVWTEMGFKEMSGELIMSSFWNFDALFTAQDHPVREMQDTFFLNKNINLNKDIDVKVINNVKQAHEKGIVGSKGWQYKWDEKTAEKLVLRTHTTCLSARTLSKADKNKLPQKYFAVGKCFRNETLDWKHGFEFNQTEGIVIDENANFAHLLGYLQEFFKKMGFEKIRFRPSYFPYTEPSVEIDVYHPEKKIWLELGGAGIFRPEVTTPLLGKAIPVLAWGPGFDRMLMDYYEIKDLRDMYKNDIKQLRQMKLWIKG
ncbi:phenylalanine--tRNA ligase subunit alpha [Candidatus Pacearchaeota archaeon]|nr:phenylalanine--tRNA ligase subunit alpha [Candidatus Pacearchaeota archaeon]